MIIYSIAKNLVKFLSIIFLRVTIEGKDNLPETGSGILISNHISNLDPPMIAIYLKRQIHFMAKEELFRVPVLNYILPHLGVFPVKRGKPDIGSIKTSLKILEKGEMLGIFPEGTRSKTGKMIKPMPGIGLLALKSGAPIIPAGISGKYGLFGKIKIVYGKPFNIKDLQEEKGLSNDLQELTEYIMTKVEELVEES